MTLDEMYKIKGQLVTELEIAQAKLQNVNAKIIEILNKPPEPKSDATNP